MDPTRVMDPTLAGFLGVLVGSLGSFAVTWITKHYDEKKARREFRQKTAFDYWQTAFQAGIDTKSSTVPFEASFFLAVKIMELTERKHLSEDEFVAELKRLRERHNIIVGEWNQTRGFTKA